MMLDLALAFAGAVVFLGPSTLAFLWFFRAYLRFAAAHEARTGVNLTDSRSSRGWFPVDVGLIARSDHAMRTRSLDPDVERLRRTAAFRWQLVWLAGFGIPVLIAGTVFLIAPLVR